MPSSRFLLAASSSSPRLRFASASVPLHFPMPSPCRCPCFPASSPLSSPHLFPPRFPMPSYSSSPASSSHFSLLPPYLPCVLLLFAAPAPPSASFPCAFPCLPTRLPQHLLRTFPRCLLIFLASSFFLPPQPPPHLPSPLFHAIALPPLHLPLCPLLFAFPRPQGKVSLLRLGLFL